MRAEQMTTRGLWLVAVLWMGGAVAAQDTIVGSPHDLSVSGPGRIHALEEEQVCIFCHAPHNATGQSPLWNRHMPPTHYRIYESSTTDARIDQPSGPSKMCLSCHDGALALGLVASRPVLQPIVMSQRTIPPGTGKSRIPRWFPRTCRSANTVRCTARPVTIRITTSWATSYGCPMCVR